MEKMMTFEEWDRLASELARGQGPFWEPLFNAARIGTMPAENAVVIPPVGEWPEGAEAIYVGFYDKTVLVKKIAHIPRPKPVWVPKVGEAVFFYDTDMIYQIDRRDSAGFYHLKGGNVAELGDLKPGKIEYLGKPWDAIPGGGE